VKVCFIYNPVAGKKAARARCRERLVALAARIGVEVEIRTTTESLHARELALSAIAGGFERIVSVGGDGTMNEVASALVNTSVPLGLVPLGSGNGLARNLGLPLAFDRAVEVALTGGVRTIDSGRVNGQAFFNVMGVGYDAALGRQFNDSKRRGFLTYLGLGVSVFRSYRMQRYEIRTEGPPVVLDAFLLSVANSTQYGNGAHIAPGAKLDDGRLDLVAIKTSKPVHVPGLLTRLFSGKIDRSPHVATITSHRFEILRDSPGPVHTDGEIHEMDTKLEVEVLPMSLTMTVPDETQES
jgi:YegS/Rv2252/BmrU family lipid kinase